MTAAGAAQSGKSPQVGSGAKEKSRQVGGEAKQTTRKAQSEADRVGNSKTLKISTRVGFIGYGVLHVAVAWVAVQLAFGRGGREADQSGAMQTLAGNPVGRVVLGIVALGLVAMVVWQALVAIIGRPDKTFDRVAAGARAVVYAVLAYSAGKAVIVGGPSSSAQKQQNATAGVMGHTAGVWLVGLIGLVVLGFGIGFAVYGLKRKFDEKLMTERMDAKTRHTANLLGAIGYVAKGVAYGIVGALLVDAAITHDPKKSRGLDSALHTVAVQPYGRILLIVVGAGIAAFGVFCVFQARYRKVGT